MLSESATAGAQVTYVEGGLHEDTVWSPEEGPYVVTGTVVLFPGNNLTIEPGTTIRFDPGTSLTIRGHLSAEGTAEDPLLFTTNTSQEKGAWDGLRIENENGGSAQLANATVEYASTGLSVQCCWGGGPVSIDSSTFRKNSVALGGYAGWDEHVSETVFEDNTYAVTRADKVIEDSVFRDNRYGLYQTERIDVYRSTFTGHDTALYGGRGQLEYNHIEDNDVGVRGFFEGFDASHNTIVGNRIGVVLTEYNSYTPPFTYNNVHDNTEYNVEVTGSHNKDGSHNWWGTTDLDAIDDGILDGHDDTSRGLLEYEPIATASISTHPPIAEIEPIPQAECIDGGAEVELDGTGSYDEDGDELSYSWSAPRGQIASPDTALSTAWFPLGSTQVTLTVSDGALKDTARAIVEVVDSRPPSIEMTRPGDGTVYVADREIANGTGLDPIAVGNLTVEANATDACGVATVTLTSSLGDQATHTQRPFTMEIDPRAEESGGVNVTGHVVDLGGHSAETTSSHRQVGTNLTIVEDGCRLLLSEFVCSLLGTAPAAPASPAAAQGPSGVLAAQAAQGDERSAP